MMYKAIDLMRCIFSEKTHMLDSLHHTSAEPEPDIHTPADCFFCGQHAIGLGIGFTSYRDNDPKWLCVDCSMMIEDIRRAKRPDSYKLKARYGGIDAAKPYFAQYGYDMSQWDEEAALMFCGAIWDGCSQRLRELVRNREAPF